MIEPSTMVARADNAERALLGSLLQDSQQLEVVRLIVTDRDFRNPLYGSVYSLVMVMFDKGEPIDAVTMRDRAVELEAIEITTELLAELHDAVPTSANAEEYARIVAREAGRREAIHALRRAHHDLHQPGADPVAIMAALTKPSPAAQKWFLSTSTLRESLDYRPFPVELMPGPVKAYVVQASRAIGCDPAFVALPLLAALASAIGNTRRIQLKASWSEPAILWTAVVAESGDLKSPALEAALRPVHRLQAEALRRHEANTAEYEMAKLHYTVALLEWKKTGEGEPPESPKLPIAERLYTDDATIEALALLLADRWRGLLVARDELCGWLLSFDRYTHSKGSDAPKWLELHAGRPVVVDRKTGEVRTIFIPRAAVSLTGAIQPAILQQVLSRDLFENGLVARLLFASPPRLTRSWTDDDIAPETSDGLQNLFEGLYSLEPEMDNRGELQPVMVSLATEAKQTWVRFYNEHAAEQIELCGDLSAAWSKLEGYAARLALVIHCCRVVAGDGDSRTVDAASVEAGVALSRWFSRETRRLYGMLSEDNNTRAQRHLIERIRRTGGTMSPRQLMRCSRLYQNADAVTMALNELVHCGIGKWVFPAPSKNGGRPSKVFRLNPSADVDKTL